MSKHNRERRRPRRPDPHARDRHEPVIGRDVIVIRHPNGAIDVHGPPDFMAWARSLDDEEKQELRRQLLAKAAA